MRKTKQGESKEKREQELARKVEQLRILLAPVFASSKRSNIADPVAFDKASPRRTRGKQCKQSVVSERVLWK